MFNIFITLSSFWVAFVMLSKFCIFSVKDSSYVLESWHELPSHLGTAFYKLPLLCLWEPGAFSWVQVVIGCA